MKFGRSLLLATFRSGTCILLIDLAFHNFWAFILIKQIFWLIEEFVIFVLLSKDFLKFEPTQQLQNCLS